MVRLRVVYLGRTTNTFATPCLYTVWAIYNSLWLNESVFPILPPIEFVTFSFIDPPAYVPVSNKQKGTSFRDIDHFVQITYLVRGRS